MHEQKPVPFTPARLARLFAWVWLWLAKYAWFLAFGGDEAKQHLRDMSCNIANFLVIRAAQRVGSLSPPGLARLDAPPGFVQRGKLSPRRAKRALAGAVLRKALRARTNGLWLAALFSVLHALEAWTDHIAKRFRRRLTRLMPIVPVRPPARLLGSRADTLEPALADSS